VNKYGPTRGAVEFQTAVQDEAGPILCFYCYVQSDFSEIQILIL